MVFQAGNAMPPELQAAFWQQLINYSQVNEAGFDWWDELNIFSAKEANAAAPAIAFYMAGVAEGVLAAIETCLASGACVRGLATITRLFAAKENLENLQKDKDKYTKQQTSANKERSTSTGDPDPNDDDNNRKPDEEREDSSQVLTKQKIVDYLKKGEYNSVEELIGDLEKIDIKLKGKSPDSKFMEFSDKSGTIRIKIHPSDKITKYEHIHLYDKYGNSLNVDLQVVDKRATGAHIPFKKKEGL